MAVVWANQAGNWTDTAIWSYWDEATQSIQLYGQGPQENDIVYCNGYIVTINSTLTISCEKITNGICEFTQRFGGYIEISTSVNVVFDCDLINDYQSTMLVHTLNALITAIVNGNVICLNNYRTFVFIHKNLNLTINGNVKGGLIRATSQGNYNNKTIIINGNVLAVGQSTFNSVAIPSGGGITISINGIVTLDDIPLGNYLDTTSALTINGGIVLKGSASLQNIGRTTSSTWTYYIDGYIDISESSTRIISTTQQVVLCSTTGLNIIGIADYPAEYNVKKDVVYDFGNKVGILETIVNQVGCVTKEDVREGVALLGMGEVGTLVVPSADDVREGVVFDNGTIGTLIVQGGGDRLRIADFGYYTNAQSDTYIVDITEADKPKFASAEERILIEMFPTLDLDNIPEMYFDDLFVKYLKYRLIVEYYRTAGINSTFTPSEPTTEIVNYRNVTCEVWLNSANTYLNAWNKKFGLNKPPQKIRL